MYQRNGRYEKRVTFENGEQKTFYGSTEREVKKKIKDYQRKLEKTSYTLAEMIEMRNKDEGSDLTPSTRRTQGFALNIISGELLRTDIDDLKAKDINAELKRLKAAGYSRSTLNVVRCVISSALKYALAEDYTENNPLTAVKTPDAPVKKRKGTSDEDAATIIKYRHDGEINFLAYFTLLTGTRHGEALALTWEDIDFDKRLIRINKTIIHDDAHKETIAPPKTEAGDRLIPIVDMLYDDLVARKAESTGRYVFNMSYTKSNREVLKYREDYGLSEGWTLHCNRHAFATECVRSSVDVKTAQYILGHADISTTLDIYADCTADMRTTAADKLSESFRAAKKRA